MLISLSLTSFIALLEIPPIWITKFSFHPFPLLGSLSTNTRRGRHLDWPGIVHYKFLSANIWCPKPSTSGNTRNFFNHEIKSILWNALPTRDPSIITTAVKLSDLSSLDVLFFRSPQHGDTFHFENIEFTCTVWHVFVPLCRWGWEKTDKDEHANDGENNEYGNLYCLYCWFRLLIHFQLSSSQVLSPHISGRHTGVCSGVWFTFNILLWGISWDKQCSCHGVQVYLGPYSGLPLLDGIYL